MRACNSCEENEFLISSDADFHNNNTSDICLALIKHYRKAICFANCFSLSFLKYLLFIVGAFTLSFCSLF